MATTKAKKKRKPLTAAQKRAKERFEWAKSDRVERQARQQRSFDIREAAFLNQQQDRANREERQRQADERQRQQDAKREQHEQDRKQHQQAQYNQAVDKQTGEAIDKGVDAVSSVPAQAWKFGSKMSMGALFGFLILLVFMTIIKVQVNGKSYSRLGLIGMAMMGRATIA